MCSHAEPEEMGSRGMMLPCSIGCCPSFVFVVVIKKKKHPDQKQDMGYKIHLSSEFQVTLHHHQEVMVVGSLRKLVTSHPCPNQGEMNVLISFYSYTV